MPVIEQIRQQRFLPSLKSLDHEGPADFLQFAAGFIAESRLERQAGRAEEAIPLLRRSLEKGNSCLTEWAREDTDLNNIRDRPEVRALLGA